ncbi:MAG: F-box protein [Candidatus Paceibacterota bacterium]
MESLSSQEMTDYNQIENNYNKNDNNSSDDMNLLKLLPRDILFEIFFYLGSKDLKNLRISSKISYEFVYDYSGKVESKKVKDFIADFKKFISILGIEDESIIAKDCREFEDSLDHEFLTFGQIKEEKKISAGQLSFYGTIRDINRRIIHFSANLSSVSWRKMDLHQDKIDNLTTKAILRRAFAPPLSSELVKLDELRSKIHFLTSFLEKNSHLFESYHTGLTLELCNDFLIRSQLFLVGKNLVTDFNAMIREVRRVELDLASLLEIIFLRDYEEVVKKNSLDRIGHHASLIEWMKFSKFSEMVNKIRNKILTTTISDGPDFEARECMKEIGYLYSYEEIFNIINLSTRLDNDKTNAPYFIKFDDVMKFELLKLIVKDQKTTSGEKLRLVGMITKTLAQEKQESTYKSFKEKINEN